MTHEHGANKSQRVERRRIGTTDVQSLGRFIDNLLGDKKARERARKRAEARAALFRRNS